MESALWAALSPLGRRVEQPAAFLPLQSAQARGKRFNATIGQITDGHGIGASAVPLPTMEAVLADLDDADRSRAFLYSPVEGLADLRRAWHERQGHATPTALPLVTVGAAQARALLGDLFAGEGRIVILREPVRPSDRDLFQLRLGSDVRTSFEGLPEGEPVLAVDRDREELLRAAERGPVVAIVDGLFRELIGVHENLVPVRVEEVEGGEVGFVTFPFPPESAVADAMEKKVKMLLRAQIGSPPAVTQVYALRQVLARRELP
ncbi:MAG: hypothetical protein ACJ759_22915 [Thermoanaerobaculia bacterium]